MITVKDLVKRTGASLAVCVSPTDTVYRALQLMAENNTGAVMICDSGHFVGIFTERDYCRKIILMGRSSVNTPIQDIMTKKMVTVCLDFDPRRVYGTDDEIPHSTPSCGR